MKKKGTSTVKKVSGKVKKHKAKKKPLADGQKVIVGEDEFCPTCMEWRAFDEITGKCKVCGHQIKKKEGRSRTINDEYDLKDFTVEHDDQQDTGEF
jgi:hypothetical protein